MDKHPTKTYPTLGYCGLDCGLCPRHYTDGSSRCPGCCGPDFFTKHPSCPFITCCAKKKHLDVCAECNEFPCSKTEDSEAVYDSFLTHRKTLSNLSFIKEHDLEEFIEQQRKRIELLEIMLKHFDDGRSKSFYCIATTLLPITDLEASLNSAEQKLRTNNIGADEFKSKAEILKELLNNFADKEGLELKLRKKGKGTNRE